MVVAVGGTSVNSGRNVSFVAAVVVVDVEVDFLFDFPKKKAIVDFLAVVDAVVGVLRDDMIEVGNLRSLVLDVVDGVGRSRVVASSSSARLPSCSRGCWVVVSSFRKYIYVDPSENISHIASLLKICSILFFLKVYIIPTD